MSSIRVVCRVACFAERRASVSPLLRRALRTLMGVVLAVSAGVVVGSIRGEDIAAGLSGPTLVRHLRDHYRPTAQLNYDEARHRMFGDVDNHGGKVRCVYTGVEVTTADIPNGATMNTEHTWPQSLFAKRLPMRADLHHLFPTLPKPNNVRANNPFHEIPDHDTERWWISNSGQTQLPPQPERERYSESTRREFEPREDHKGNVARALLYVWAVYGDKSITPGFLDGQKQTLVLWHRADPVDDAERTRSAKIKALQGNENPFVLDPTLVDRVLQTPGSPPVAPLSLAAAAPASSSAATAASTATATTASSQKTASQVTTPFSGGEFSDRHRFPDFKLEYKPTETQYSGELFHLSQDFQEYAPGEKPDYRTDADLVRLMNEPYDRQEHVESYLAAVREYCLKGNKLAGADNEFTNAQYEKHWNQDEKSQWYHVPWQHYGEKGREGIHGLTREASTKPTQLADSQTKEHETHAVALYNFVGGYTIGEVWKNQFAPNANAARFEPGTVVVKVLFTQAKADEVPHLVNPLIWKAYIRDPSSPKEAPTRSVQELRLLQMDVMIRDDRAKQTGGWIFGTYCYNGEVNRKNKWYNLVPVGVQWGNDEDFRKRAHNKDHTQLAARKPTPNPLLRETLINRSDDLPPQHLGWGGRLNGPADYFRSSCMSCHSTAQYPGLEKQHPDFELGLGYQPGDEKWNSWFRNLDCGIPFGSVSKTDRPRRSYSMDFSLQLQIGIENFYDWKGRTMGGYFTFRDDTAKPSSEADEPPKAP